MVAVVTWEMVDGSMDPVLLGTLIYAAALVHLVYISFPAFLFKCSVTALTEALGCSRAGRAMRARRPQLAPMQQRNKQSTTPKQNNQ